MSDKKVTIEIKEDTLEFLKTLLTNMNEQSNRGTATPYYYVVKEYPKSWKEPEDVLYADGIFDHKEGETLTFEDIIERLRENEEVDDFIKFIHHEDTDFDIDDAEFEDLLEYAREKWDMQAMEETKEEAEHNFFLTEKACDQFIKSNNYHYTDPGSYVRHLWRNPEMLQVVEALAEVSGIDLIKH